MTSSQTQRTVLVVDDHPPLRTLCRVNLEAADFRVLEATDGDEALALVRADRPDVILLDIMMPRVSGWEVAAALLADQSADRIPIIFITARTGVTDRIRAFELGAHAYLTKPFDPDSSVAGVLVRRSGLGRRGHRAALPGALPRMAPSGFRDTVSRAGP